MQRTQSTPLPNQTPACRGLVALSFAGSGQARSRLGSGWGWGSEFEDTARATTTTPLPHKGSRPSLRSAPSVAVPPERGACRRHRRGVRDGSESRDGNQHGQGESSDEGFHDTSPYLDHCPCFASALKTNRPAPARGNMAAPAAAACDGDHRFRTIQNDSDPLPGAGDASDHATPLRSAGVCGR